MKIGNSKEVKGLQFKHNGKQLNFRCTFDNRFLDYQTIEPSTIVNFEFDDLAEIKILIQMLERFESLCEKSFGTWEMG